jgi:hypothetical protein
MLSAAARCCLFQAEGKSRMKKSLLALGLTVLTGCAIEHVSPEDPKSFIPDRSAVIAVGRMDRAAVRGILGTTRLSSAYWGFDLFRTDTEQSEVVYAVTPWPIPFARFTDQLQRFTLVAYDADGRASAVASGLFRRPAKWRNTSPITFDHPSLHLRAGELMFFADPEGARDVNLLVSPLRRDAFLEGARSAKGCTAVLGCGDRGCGDRLTVDASPPRRLPVRTAHAYWFGKGEPDSWLRGAEPHGSDVRMPWLEALVALKLAAGEHALEFSAAHLDGRTSLNFKCRPGEIIYLTIHASSNESFWRPALVDWRIDQDATMPERFARRPMVIMDDGKWVIDAEPDG